MQYDEYMRHLDLRDNKFEEAGLKGLFESVWGNKSLVSIEIRGNPGYKPKLHQLFALELLNKYNMIQRKGKLIDPKWIKRNIFHVSVPKKILKQIQQNRGEAKINIVTSTP